MIATPERWGRGLRLPALLLALTVMHARAEDPRMMFDFRTGTAAGSWEIVNDTVMGGVSTSEFALTNGVAVFRGRLSLDNQGGFASVRTGVRPVSGMEDAVFLIRVRGDGRRYRFTARTRSAWDAPLYQCGFESGDGEWRDLRLPVRDFQPSFRGRPLPGEPPLDLSRLTSVGFLVADRQAGPFRLEIESIRICIKVPQGTQIQRVVHGRFPTIEFGLRPRHDELRRALGACNLASGQLVLGFDLVAVWTYYADGHRAFLGSTSN